MSDGSKAFVKKKNAQAQQQKAINTLKNKAAGFQKQIGDLTDSINRNAEAVEESNNRKPPFMK